MGTLGVGRQKAGDVETEMGNSKMGGGTHVVVGTTGLDGGYN